MALRQLVPWTRRVRARLTEPFESMRGLVEPMEHFFEKPWTFSGGLEGTPRVDVEETPAEIVVSARLPGMKRDDVKIDVTETTLTLRGSLSRAGEQRRHGMLQRREMEQSFVRRFALPAPVKTAEAKAAFKGDLLEIRLPRVTQAQVRRVDIE